MKLFIISCLCLIATGLFATGSSSGSSGSGTQQTIIEQNPTPYYFPNYAPPDQDIDPGETEANDIYKANKHR